MPSLLVQATLDFVEFMYSYAKDHGGVPDGLPDLRELVAAKLNRQRDRLWLEKQTVKLLRGLQEQLKQAHTLPQTDAQQDFFGQLKSFLAAHRELIDGCGMN